MVEQEVSLSASAVVLFFVLSMSDVRRVLLVQLPIPPAGPGPVEGNVPLAAAYLKLCARRRGLEETFDIDLLPPELANTLGDQGLIEEILARRPWMVGFTCYLWNVERTLWIAQRLKQRQPEAKILAGRAGNHGRQRLGASASGG